MDERKPNVTNNSGARQPRRGRRPVPARNNGPAAPHTQQRARRNAPWKRRAVEFLVIVAGIMVSFLLNEWRQQRRDRDQEKQLLIDLRTDLRDDSTAFAAEAKDLDMVLGCITRLKQHQQRPIPADSVLQVLGPPLSYVGISMQDVTYQAMKSTGTVTLVQDRELVRDVFELYGRRYFMLREAADIDKRMVLEHMLPMVNQRFVLGETTTADLHRLMQDVQWRNLIDFSEFHKGRTQRLLTKEQQRINELIQRINAHVQG